MVALPALGIAYLSYEKAAKNLISNELDYLKLDESGVEHFVRDYAKGKSENYLLKVRGLYLLGSSASQSKIVEELVKDYMLATDFFRNRMDESRTIKYVGLYNPYTTPCANPFSAVYYPPLNT